jgi:hypothetical protein
MNPNINEANKNNGIAGSLEIMVAPKDDGLYVCRLSRSSQMQVTGSSLADIVCDGQTPEHALAIGLEQLAAEYRRLAEESQAIPNLAVEKTATGDVIEKYFHVTVHFEGILRNESKFEVIHNTLVGNKGSNLKRDTGWGGLCRLWGFQGFSWSWQFSHTWNNPLK